MPNNVYNVYKINAISPILPIKTNNAPMYTSRQAQVKAYGQQH